MIKVIVRKGTLIPIVICDICFQEIIDLDQAAAVNPPLMELKEENPSEVIYAHKGKCHDVAEHRLQMQYGRKPGWEALSTHLYFLCYNGGLTPEKMAQKDWAFKQLGRRP